MTTKIHKKLTPEEVNKFCVWLQDELEEANLQNGLLKISCEQKAGLLESCETALNERDQQNEALLAQVALLSRRINAVMLNISSETLDALQMAVDTQPEQSLDSLKARIEEETIGRCAKAVSKEPLVRFALGHPYEDDQRIVDGAREAIRSMPRKYQPSTKADKGEME